jgi:glutamate/tyrosine decarboxylase-like PLP-dependent enzyme
MIACADSAHSSVASAANVMDVDVLRVETDKEDRLTGSALRDAIDGGTAERLFAVVGSGGSTNAGVVDDLSGIADVCADLGVWLHVDGAYGGAALAASSVRPLFNGIERADSFIVDPHKWLFAPFDACALLYRDPTLARAAHTQHAAYLESLNLRGEWNPSDYAHHLTRRARGIPLWFSLATSGTDAYRDAVESVLSLAREAADEIRKTPGLELLNEPDLTVLLFRRDGWSSDDYEAWWRKLLDDQIAFVQPTTWRGEKVARLCFVNPRTTIDHVRAILATMA